MSYSIERLDVEKGQNWADEIPRIPFIKFPADWEVKIIPPIGDAVVRFLVKVPNVPQKSVYLDSRMSLGYCEEPYWEVYPVDDDAARCNAADVEQLLNLIASK